MKPGIWLTRPDYVVNRLKVWWWERQHPNDPWLTADIVNLLEDWLKPTDRGIEFGSGRSTTWFGRRVGHLISVELDDTWLGLVESQLKEFGVESRVDIRYFPIDQDWKMDIDNSPYVRAVDDVPDESVDFVLVDGWARAHCSLIGMAKLKPGGVLIIDDIQTHSPLPEYRVKRGRIPPFQLKQHNPALFETVMEELKCWRCIWTANGKKDTALWVKPDRS